MGSEVRLLFPPPLLMIDAGVTQWLEFLPSKQAVEGSNPFTRSTKIIKFLEAEVQFLPYFIQLYIILYNLLYGYSNHNKTTI